jgi:uncharacterized membrane protein
MGKVLVAYAGTAIVMVVLDGLWLGVVAKPLYEQGIGHLMAERPNLWAAGAFYLLFAAGLVVFAVMPNEAAPGWGRTLLAGALFGFFAYATYDLTNLATLMNWPVALSLMDMAWGTVVSALSAGAGKAAVDRFAAG